MRHSLTQHNIHVNEKSNNHNDNNNNNNDNNNNQPRKKRRTDRRKRKNITTTNNNIISNDNTINNIIGKRQRKYKRKEEFIYSQENYDDNDHGNRPNLVPLFITVFAMISEINTFITNTTELKYQEKVRLGLPPNSDYEIQNRSDRDKWL